MSNSTENGTNVYVQQELDKLREVALRDPRGTFGYDTGRRILRFTVEEGLIDSTQVRRVLDFGAGEGGSTLAIQEVFPEAEVEAAEMAPWRALNFRRAGELLPGNLFVDGIIRLNEVKDKPLERYDLVVGSMFGPWDAVNFSEFLAATQGAVNKGGQTLIYSDSVCVERIIEHLTRKAIPFVRARSDVFSVYGTHDTVHIPAISPELEL